MADFKETLAAADEAPLVVERGNVVEIRVENANPGRQHTRNVPVHRRYVGRCRAHRCHKSRVAFIDANLKD